MPPEMKTIPDLPDYFAASDGTIWRLKGNTLAPVKARKLKNGYLAANVRRSVGKWVTEYIHRLVAMAWHGLPPAGAQTRHLNGNKNDCTPTNLAWGDARSNHQDKVRQGRNNAGERNPAARLNRMTAFAAKEAVALGVSRKKVAARYGVSKHTIGALVRGVTWQDNPGEAALAL
ncbi:MAG TPA: HNH endonuclease [Urbifossiella sp.]|jgi:hypothetical protein|nr:HNH endonuclease [Urbifossiella sp.]